MSYIQKVGLSEANKLLPSNSAMLCFASFEERCITLAENIDPNKFQKAFVFRNINPSIKNHSKTYFNMLSERLNAPETIEVDLDFPVDLAEKIIAVLQKIVRSNIYNVVVDISTFTHEALLILIKQLYIQQGYFKTIYFVYNGASKYAAWLSMGCKTIRNVVGYPGCFNPAYKDHLIVLTGFEKERTTKLVELFDPDVLSFGYGSEPTDSNHQDTMAKMKDDFNAWFRNLGLPSNSFDFSCSSIDRTVNQVKEIINNSKNENIVLVPLNTKLSTISAALVALKDIRVQVVYPIPETYNVNYSSPSAHFTIINLKAIPEFSRID